MSVNPAEEESESINEMGRIARGLGMAGMQMREASERKRDRADRQAQAGEADQQRQAQDRHRDGAVTREGTAQGRLLSHSSGSRPRTRTWRAPSPTRKTSPRRDMDQRTAPTWRSRTACVTSTDSTSKASRQQAQTAPNGSTHSRQHSMTTTPQDASVTRHSINDHAEESIREEHQAQSEDEATHDPALREAAVNEAAETGMDTDEYLDQLSPDDREALVN